MPGTVGVWWVGGVELGENGLSEERMGKDGEGERED